ncbi:NUMOD4 motif-containing HNH endonuclease [Staphylococcus aureus]|uniref:NUMOD4 motif-containing HNH endonuclease n=2 Tax=Staphylococcus aureus TaxID=1280 RepID=UPI0020BFDD91|nr:NUMOD4 motif-containing HNH endonuclease [Staphylococcus aureus]
MREKWKAVEGYEGLYEVSNLGRVKSLKRAYRPADKIMKFQCDKDGYHEAKLSKDGKNKIFKVHRLVYAAFVGPIPDGHVIDHKNNIKTSNRPHNLEPITIAENNKRAAERRKRDGIKKVFFTKDELETIRWQIEAGTCMKVIAETWDVSPRRIYDVNNRFNKKGTVQ